jgi:hypothetical protein
VAVSFAANIDSYWESTMAAKEMVGWCLAGQAAKMAQF